MFQQWALLIDRRQRTYPNVSTQVGKRKTKPLERLNEAVLYLRVCGTGAAVEAPEFPESRHAEQHAANERHNLRGHYR